MSKKILPSVCPSCRCLLRVRRLDCSECGTALEGEFDFPLLARLELEDQEFILNLLKAGGSLKELASLYSISYPTVRNRLDNLINKVEQLADMNNLNQED